MKTYLNIQKNILKIKNYKMNSFIKYFDFTKEEKIIYNKWEVSGSFKPKKI